jgi:glutamate N-acetyltransferase/amino-acid N-acetyltransferase
MNMQYIEGGICAPKGFQAAGVHCGIRKNKTKKDLALIVSKVPASAAGVYTQNKVQGAPITVTKANLTAQNGYARAIICNSGNANTCNPNGIEIAQKTCALVGETLSLPAESVLVASTGVIGMELSLEPFQTGIPAVVNALSDSGSEDAAHAIMTTDTVKKETAVSFVLDGKTCHIGAIAKGSGMIHPNMATLLCFITTDVAIGPALLQQALKEAVDESLNQVSIDGDTSTNDMALVMANGMAENKEITEAGEEYSQFVQALTAVCVELAKKIAADGEGATKLLCCKVSGAPDVKTARVVAKSVISSSLFKAAMFGADANWGRILCAMGYADAEYDISKTSVALRSPAGRIEVCENAAALPFSEEKAALVLAEKEIHIEINLHQGAASASAWGCDLTYDYVKINGDYRS